MYHVNKNVELIKVQSVYVLSNFDNQAVIGLDKKGWKFWEKVTKHVVEKTDIAENKELYDSLLELKFLQEQGVKVAEGDLEFNLAYVHLLNRCNLNCLGCYSMNDERNQEQDSNTEDWKKAFQRLSQAGVSSIVISGGEPFRSHLKN